MVSESGPSAYGSRAGQLQLTITTRFPLDILSGYGGGSGRDMEAAK